MTDLRNLLSEARAAIESLEAIIEGEISRDWSDIFYADWLIADEAKSRIDAALAEKVEPVAIGEVKESGVVWANQNPHAYPIGTKFYAAPADQDRVDAERWRMAKSLAVVRKSGRKLYKTDDPIPSYRLIKNADVGVIKPEINEEYEVCLFACIGETSIPEMDALMDNAIDRARSAK